MSLIDDFLAEYAREIDFYDNAARLVREQIEALLRSSGTRAIVTARAKRPDRLGEKLKQRAPKKKYASLDEIRRDIVDLAGVRVALYFPGDRPPVNALIAANFDAVSAPKEFPDDAEDEEGDGTPEQYKKRFSGYGATHHRVRLKEAALSEERQRYSTAVVEVQIASVLMHAWAEVEHDLVYKPLGGELSLDEHAILDELNGLMLAGEISLERLQRAVEARVKDSNLPFSNQYELAAHLSAYAEAKFGKEAEPATMGRVDWLLELLRQTELDSPGALAPFLDALDPDIERRPIADQVVDKVVAGDPARYDAYEKIKLPEAGQRSPYGPANKEEFQLALGVFLQRWIVLERALSKVIRTRRGARPGPVFSLHELRSLAGKDFSIAVAKEIEQVRQVRNVLMHGETGVAPVMIREASDAVVRILKGLAADGSDLAKEAAIDALGHLELGADVV